MNGNQIYHAPLIEAQPDINKFIYLPTRFAALDDGVHKKRKELKRLKTANHRNVDFYCELIKR